MGPLRFDEFLLAIGAEKEYRALGMLELDNLHLIPDTLHERLLSHVRHYTLMGGMPYCIQIGLDTQFTHADVLKYQLALLLTYRDDFAKYTGSLHASQLNAYFNGLIRQVGQQFSHQLAQDISQTSSGNNRQNNRQLNDAIERFIAARLFYRVLHTHADAVPLGAETKIRISKLLFIDIGWLPRGFRHKRSWARLWSLRVRAFWRSSGLANSCFTASRGISTPSCITGILRVQ